ncbi:MAG: histidine kinase dimerization/phospho-acceptor domain-containing protein, partial [Candidatus Kapaibacteriota bacterium]
MLRDLLNLVPERVNYESFWEEIRKRNKWLIQLRYFAFLLLSGFAVGSLVVQYFYTQIRIESTTILIISFCILVYNILFHYLWYKFPDISNKIKIHSLHFSLFQIIVDLIFLIILIYYTGGVESPFNTFLVFHVIIGSLILPGTIIGLIMGICIFLLICLSLLELNHVIPHYLVQGIIKHPLYNEPIYLIVFFATLSIVVFVSIYLANSIAKVLYQREKELNLAYKELQEAEKVKSRYVMTIVHDLKTPINASLTWVNIIANNEIGVIPEYLRNPIERIRARLNSALNLINDVLKLSQIKLSGEIRKEPVNL